MSFMSTVSADRNLSHEQRASSFQVAKQTLADKIQSRGDLPHVKVQDQLELLEKLASFEFGRFLIERGGLNGYWTHYVITHPTNDQLTNPQDEPFHPLEAFLLNSAPTCLATQQRFTIFKEQIQKEMKEGCSLASVPCGLMADLLDLDYSSLHAFTLHGVDLDPEALALAKSYAQGKGLGSHCDFSLKNAWSLEITEQFDLIASNGLAMYEPDDDKVIDLYRQFYTALKPNGTLITSFLTPPPAPGLKTEWKVDLVNLKDALMQKILFADVLDAKWQAFRSEEVVRNQLKQAGFASIEILYDKAHIFPVVSAKK